MSLGNARVLLQSSPVLEAMAVVDQMLLAERSVPRSAGTEDRLFVAGDRVEWVHLLVSGVVKLVATSPEGEETILALATAGDLLGDVAALDGLGQPLDAVAAMDCELLALDADNFVGALSRNAEAAVELCRSFSTRVRWMFDTAAERTTFPVPARLASRLLDLADSVGKIDGGAIRIDVPLDQSDIARLSGMCRETACRTLRRFKRAGVVDYDRKKNLRILRPDILERVRCMGH